MSKSVEDLIRDAMDRSDHESMSASTCENVLQDLPRAHKYVDTYGVTSAASTNKFNPGDLITWKPYMRNLKNPKYEEPVMVLETFPAIRHDSDGTPYGCEPYDMRCIAFFDDEEAVVFAYNSRRMIHFHG